MNRYCIQRPFIRNCVDIVVVAFHLLNILMKQSQMVGHIKPFLPFISMDKHARLKADDSTTKTGQRGDAVG